jgi:hypothetical protein
MSVISAITSLVSAEYVICIVLVEPAVRASIEMASGGLYSTLLKVVFLRTYVSLTLQFSCISPQGIFI